MPFNRFCTLFICNPTSEELGMLMNCESFMKIATTTCTSHEYGCLLWSVGCWAWLQSALNHWKIVAQRGSELQVSAPILSFWLWIPTGWIDSALGSNLVVLTDFVDINPGDRFIHIDSGECYVFTKRLRYVVLPCTTEFTSDSNYKLFLHQKAEEPYWSEHRGGIAIVS